jgi:hypothetical protein
LHNCAETSAGIKTARQRLRLARLQLDREGHGLQYVPGDSVREWIIEQLHALPFDGPSFSGSDEAVAATMTLAPSGPRTLV